MVEVGGCRASEGPWRPSDGAGRIPNKTGRTTEEALALPEAAVRVLEAAGRGSGEAEKASKGAGRRGGWTMKVQWSFETAGKLEDKRVRRRRMQKVQWNFTQREIMGPAQFFL